MMQENEIFAHVIGPLGEQGFALNEKLSADEIDELRQTLAAFLVATADDNAGVTVTTEELPAGLDFKSILYKTAGPRTNKILVFAFTDAAAEAFFPLLGIVLAIYTGKWGVATIPHVGSVLKTLWSKLVVLKRPADADAIDILNALVRVRTRHVTSDSKNDPTTREIEIDSGLSKDRVLAALKTLQSRNVIEVIKWGEQTDDLTHSSNTWKVKL